MAWRIRTWFLEKASCPIIVYKFISMFMYARGSQPVGHDSLGVSYRISYISRIYLMIHNSSNLTVMR